MPTSEMEQLTPFVSASEFTTAETEMQAKEQQLVTQIIEKAISEHFIDIGALKGRRVVIFEYTAGYPKHEVWDYKWILQENLAERFSGLYKESVIYRAITNWMNWRHARVVVIEEDPKTGFTARVYGYSEGQNKSGAIKENGTSWKCDPQSKHQLAGYTDMSYSDILSTANQLVSNWQSKSIRYNLFLHNCEHFSDELVKAICSNESLLEFYLRTRESRPMSVAMNSAINDQSIYERRKQFSEIEMYEHYTNSSDKIRRRTFTSLGMILMVAWILSGRGIEPVHISLRMMMAGFLVLALYNTNFW